MIALAPPFFGAKTLPCDGSAAHSADDRDGRALARHLCLSHCDALDLCREWSAGIAWVGVTVAGISFKTNSPSEPVACQPKPNRNACPICKAVKR